MMICCRCQQELPDANFDIKKDSGRQKKVCRPCCKLISKQIRARKKEHPPLAVALVNGKSYQSRMVGLQQLGFASYADYLRSDLWKQIRRKVYTAKGTSCYLCQQPATELHHNRYHLNDLTGKKMRYINPICRTCHEQIEFQDGKKATVRQASRAFKTNRKKLNRRARNSEVSAFKGRPVAD